jgi:DedD protein
MSKPAKFRELQFTSSELAAVFIGVLIVGVIVFILGVSVGKKQDTLSAAAGRPGSTPTGTEKVETTTVPVPPATAKPVAPKPPDAGKPAAAKPAEAKLAESKPAVAPAKAGTYYVQASAASDKATATAFARRLEKDGFKVVVLDPYQTDTKTFFRVRVGPFPTKDEAEAARTKLAALLKKRSSDFCLVKT